MAHTNREPLNDGEYLDTEPFFDTHFCYADGRPCSGLRAHGRKGIRLRYRNNVRTGDLASRFGVGRDWCGMVRAPTKRDWVP